MEALVREKGIDCGWERTAAYIYAADHDQVEWWSGRQKRPRRPACR
jgi:hypothetical protein